MKFKLLLFFMLITQFILAQSSLYYKATTRNETAVTNRAILNNPASYDTNIETQPGFLLSQGSLILAGGVTYDWDIQNSKAFENQVMLEGELIFNIIPAFKPGNWVINFPFRGNILDPFGQNRVGLGIYPFANIPEQDPGYDLILHLGYEGGFNLQGEEFEDTPRGQRIYGGFDLQAYINGNTKPVGIGAVLVHEIDNLITGTSTGLEGTAIYEIIPGYAVLVGGYWDLSKGEFDRPSGFRTGIALVSRNAGTAFRKRSK